MAALATILKLQPNLRLGLSTADSSLAAALGPIAGLALAAPLVCAGFIRFILSYLNKRFYSWFIFVSVPIMAVMFFAELFTRTTIAVAVVSNILSIPAESSCAPDFVASPLCRANTCPQKPPPCILPASRPPRRYFSTVSLTLWPSVSFFQT